MGVFFPALLDFSYEKAPDWKASLRNTEGERAKYLGELLKRFPPPNSSSLPFSSINFASVIRMSLFRSNQRLRIRVRVFDSRLRRSFQTSFLHFPNSSWLVAVWWSHAGSWTCLIIRLAYPLSLAVSQLSADPEKLRRVQNENILDLGKERLV